MISAPELREVIALNAVQATNFKESNVELTAETGRSMATKLVMTALTMERGVLSGA